MLAHINSILNDLVWGIPTLTLIIGTGILFTIFTKGFQFTYFFYGMKEIFGGILKQKATKKTSHSQQSISQFQALCTALSGTIGTGNISGIAYAIVMGGAGSIFWLWIAAMMGMITSFAEKVLGVYYRHRNEKGEWCGGAMYYLRDGLGSQKHCKFLGSFLAAMYALFTIFASFGIGNLSQIASIRESILSLTSFTNNFRIDSFLIGTVVAVLTAFAILGGLTRIAKINEILVPFMAVFYIVGTSIIIFLHADKIMPAFLSIFQNAFSFQAAAGGIGGAMIKQAMTWGLKRGVFSNEAGLGSSVIVYASADVEEPVTQGFWGMFEVFFDTIVLCTLTALLILTSGLIDLNTGTTIITDSGFALATNAFTASFGSLGGWFMTIAISLFAFATLLGWSYYGVKSWEYLFGSSLTTLYKYIYVAIILLGCTLNVDFIIELSDTFNGLLAIPNLIGLLSLTTTFLAVLDNYKRRKLGGETHLKPMLNYFSSLEHTVSRTEPKNLLCSKNRRNLWKNQNKQI